MEQNEKDRYKPQLVMYRAHLDDLPALALPEGTRLRTFRDGDLEPWERIILESFKEKITFAESVGDDPAYRPERVFFICDADAPVATATAWFVAKWGWRTGYLHMVGARPGVAGRGLGYQVSLAALHWLRREGRDCCILQTDDFRVPALVTYVKLGFVPYLIHDNQRDRWSRIFETIGRPELTRRLAAHLAGPIRWTPK
jgi:mycothiol synthase